MFSRSRNPLLTFLLSYHVWVTSKIQVNFRYRRYSKVLIILSYEFSKFLQYSCFRVSWNLLLTFLLSYHVPVTLKIQVNFRYRSRRYSKVLIVLSYEFLKFLSIHVFEVQKYIADIPTKLPCSGYLENPGELPVQEVLKGTDDSVLWIFEISSVFMFSRSRIPLLTFLLSYHIRMTSKIQINFRYRRYWWFCLMDFWNFSTIYVFEVMECHCWYSYLATAFGWPRKSGSTSGSRGFWGYPKKVAQ